MFLSPRKQAIAVLCESIDWLLYEGNIFVDGLNNRYPGSIYLLIVNNGNTITM